MPALPATRTWQRRLWTLVVAAFVLFFVVVCGTGLLPQPPTTFGQDCGSVNVGPNQTIEGDPQPPETCLATAFTRCQAANLTYNHAGTDTGEQHQLQVVPAAKGCLVEDRYHFSSAVPGLERPGDNPMYTCKSVQLVADGLAVGGCTGEDDFVIPLYPAVIGQGCGDIRYVKSEAQGQLQSDPPDALRCFWQAYTQCQAATLVFYTDTYPRPSNVLPPAMFISFQPSNGACAISLVERYTGYPANTFAPRHCADLLKRGVELVVTGCGALDDVVIPLGPGSPPPSP